MFPCFVLASMFCPRFSQKQSTKGPEKNTCECFTIENWKPHAKIQALLKKKNFTREGHLHWSCIKSFNYWCNFHIDPIKARLFKSRFKMLGIVKKNVSRHLNNVVPECQLWKKWHQSLRGLTKVCFKAPTSTEPAKPEIHGKLQSVGDL